LKSKKNANPFVYFTKFSTVIAACNRVMLLQPI
jgi:hypothetical protein